MTNPDYDLVFSAAKLSEAMYVRNLPVWREGDNEGDYRIRLEKALVDTSGENSGNKITESLAQTIASEYKLVRSKETTGFTGGVFEDRNGNAVLAIRGTATGRNVIDDLDIVWSGTARKAATQMADFWNKDCADLHDKSLVVTGHSLGGALASDFAKLYPENTSKVVTFNSAGVSNHWVTGPSESWWKERTDQKIDNTWGADKTIAFQTDSGHKMVHMSAGPVYRQIGEQIDIPYAERPAGSIQSRLLGAESHSITPLVDALAFEGLAYDLGLPKDMADKYVKSLGDNGPQALYDITDHLSVAVGANTVFCPAARDAFYQTVNQVALHAPAVKGEVIYLVDYSKDALAHEAMQETPRGEAIRSALQVGSPVAALRENQAAHDILHPLGFYAEQAVGMLSAEQKTLGNTNPAVAQTIESSNYQSPMSSMAEVRQGLGKDAAAYSDSQLAARIPPEVLNDIVVNGFPSKEVASLQEYIQNVASKQDPEMSRIDKVAAFDALIHISTSDTPVILKGLEQSASGGAAEASITLQPEVLRDVAVGRAPVAEKEQPQAQVQIQTLERVR